MSKPDTTLLPATQSAPAALLRAKPKASEMMAGRLGLDPAKLVDTLSKTVFKGATNEELAALVVVSNEYDLNPFLKEIYAFPAKGGGIVPVVSVDGWIKMLNRQPQYDGIEFEFKEGADGKPESCTAIIFAKNRSKPVKVTEYYGECYRNTDPWNKAPRRLLRHKTLIQAARVAFGFAGVYDDDEGRDQADVTRMQNVTPATTRPVLPVIEVAAEKQGTGAAKETPSDDTTAAPAAQLSVSEQILLAANQSEITQGRLMQHLKDLNWEGVKSSTTRLSQIVDSAVLDNILAAMPMLIESIEAANTDQPGLGV